MITIKLFVLPLFSCKNLKQNNNFIMLTTDKILTDYIKKVEMKFRFN